MAIQNSGKNFRNINHQGTRRDAKDKIPPLCTLERLRGISFFPLGKGGNLGYLASGSHWGTWNYSLRSGDMRFGKLAFICALFVLFSASLPAQETKESVQNRYMEYLRTEGYVPSIDEDGDVRFRYEGGTYYIIILEDDAEFIRVLYPNFWEIESDEELGRAYKAASYVNRTTKIAKVFVNRNEDDVSIVGESLLRGQDDYKSWFKRILSAIGTARRDFRDEMNSY
jgi:hypothetical protein